MEISYITKNDSLYIVAIAYGRNFNGNVYARLIISNNSSATNSEFSREISFDSVLNKLGVLENAEYTKEIDECDIPSYRKVVPLQNPLFWSRGDLIKIYHAPVGIKTNKGTVINIRTTFIPVRELEDTERVIDYELTDLFNRKGALYYQKDEFLPDYRKYIGKVNSFDPYVTREDTLRWLKEG